MVNRIGFREKFPLKPFDSKQFPMENVHWLYLFGKEPFWPFPVGQRWLRFSCHSACQSMVSRTDPLFLFPVFSFRQVEEIHFHTVWYWSVRNSIRIIRIKFLNEKWSDSQNKSETIFKCSKYVVKRYILLHRVSDTLLDLDLWKLKRYRSAARDTQGNQILLRSLAQHWLTN